jgi:hypothetical protein
MANLRLGDNHPVATPAIGTPSPIAGHRTPGFSFASP